MIKILTLLSLALLCGLFNGGRVYGDESCQKLKDLEYELYGTKTMYDTARRYIKKHNDDLPKSFDDDSLEEEHKDLIEDQCKPIIFYFIGRHAARFPDGEDIEQYNKQLNDLNSKLSEIQAAKRCPDKFESFLQWKPRMEPKLDNLITEFGAQQQRDIARRFKSIYPRFFDTKTANIEVGVTTKIRTAQTAVEFLKEVEGLNLSNCNEGSLPSNDLDKAGYSIDKIISSSCYKGLMDRNAKDFLEFHKKCEKISGKSKVVDPLVEKVKDPKLVEEIAERVSRKLELDIQKGSNSTISAGLLDSIFDTCKFENAFIKGGSIWCDLFSKKDVQVLEYIEDIGIYIKSAYGAAANVKQSCPLVKNLVETFSEGLKMSGDENEKVRSYFYFSHASPMKKLLATFGMFKDDDSYTERKVNQFASELKADKDREWRTSLVVPFSGNLAFTLYRCAKPGKSVKHKILATVTEQPVKLGGCKDTDCSSDRFFRTYDPLKSCNLAEVCAPRL